uniref:Abnormal cell migration protein 18-like fibronectin type I domain-containing protein n=1 Tax=Meloidogyne hapla TaxID=6305 RepID=A0A1I8BDZ6_MELHA
MGMCWEGIYLKKRQIGCIFNENNKTKINLNIGEQKIKEKTVYECQKNEYGILNILAIECISNDGKRYKIGKQWTEGDFIFYCKKRIDSSNCEKTCIGCFHKNQNLFDGDRFELNKTVFQCEIRPKRHLIKPVACISEGRVERVIDCKWFIYFI